MKKKKKKEYLKILELGANASRDDIENAYSHFVKLYSSEDSPEIHPLKEEIPKKERKKILSEIDKAYKALVGEDGVNRIDFSAEIEPQEIILDEEDELIIEHVEIGPSEEALDESEPVVEFEFPEEQIEEVPVHESIDDIEENNDPIVEVLRNEKGYNENPDEIEPQIIEFEEDLPNKGESDYGNEEEKAEIIETPKIEFEEDSQDEGSGDNVTEEPEVIESQVIEFEEDSPDEVEGNEGKFEEEPVEIELEEAIIDKAQDDKKVEITGKYLKKIRESRKLKVKDVGEILNITHKSIVHIESEKFDKLNDAGYLRWLIRSYSKLLGLNEEKSAEDYMRRYRLKK